MLCKWQPEIMAEKLDNLDAEIERELHNLSLDTLSTSDVDSVADVSHSLPNSPAKDSVSSQCLLFYYAMTLFMPGVVV